MVDALYLFSTENGGYLQRITKEHSHEPNLHRLRAAIEER